MKGALKVNLANKEAELSELQVRLLLVRTCGWARCLSSCDDGEDLWVRTEARACVRDAGRPRQFRYAVRAVKPAREVPNHEGIRKVASLARVR
jgi:hypothetical protein